MDAVTIGTLIGLAVTVVGSTWKLNSRLGAIERSLGEAIAELRANARATEHRVVTLETQAATVAGLRDRIVRMETRCDARHGEGV